MKMNVEETIRPILEQEDIFGGNLYEMGLANKIYGYFGVDRGQGHGQGRVKKYLK